MQNKLTRFLFYALLALVVLQLFSSNEAKEQNVNDDVVIRSEQTFTLGEEVRLSIQNNTSSPLPLCSTNPVGVDAYKNGEWVTKKVVSEECEGIVLEIAPGSVEEVSFQKERFEIFDQKGNYRISYPVLIGEKEKNFVHEVEFRSPGLIRRGWNAFLYKPIFNTLVYFISIIPSHNLGWGIILLTLVIKLILLGPNHKALKAQKKLQNIQPQLDALKEKYKDDPQRMAQETMEVWKKYKVNPLGSCLPMLIQFPILIALFYVVKDGLGVIDPNLLYSPLKAFEAQSVDPVFLGLIDLTKINIFALPLIVAGLQFFQIRLSLGKNRKKNQSGSNAMPAMMGNMMQFMLPAMIAIFTATLPAAVGFYWGTSTLFAIFQQLAVNHSKN